uniref:Ig-like domain-containing protein n=1 Tax=Lates calcarifer TaxID=8187 RepID=A0A4W6F9E5_LATCA
PVLYYHVFGKQATTPTNMITKIVDVGDDVKLTCPRQTSDHSINLFWIRLVSGDLPEFLGGTFSFDYDGVNKTPRITAKQEPGTFILLISKTELSDTGVYYCIKAKQLGVTFLKGAFLRIKGPEPDITAIVQVPPSDPVHPGDSVTLQCSVLSDTEKKTCPGDHSVYWFRAGSDESHPSLIYAHRNSSDYCENSHEAHSLQKCVYNFPKTVSSSDSGTYYCAVCGTFLYNGTITLNMWDLQKANTVLFLIFAILAVSLFVIAFLIYTIKKNKCDCSFLTLSSSIFSQRHGDMSVYSAVVFTMIKAGGGAIKDGKAAERERIYAAVKAFGLNQ